MGLFGLGKKKESTVSDAPAPQAGGEEMKKCEKCGKEVPASNGSMVLGGSAFCCNTCCPPDHEHTDDGVCEFC